MAVGREVVVLSGVRTPVGNYGGSLKDFSPATLGAMVIQEAVGRAGVAPDDVGHVVFGHVIPTEKHDVYLARVAAVNAGLPVNVTRGHRKSACAAAGCRPSSMPRRRSCWVTPSAQWRAVRSP